MPAPLGDGRLNAESGTDAARAGAAEARTRRVVALNRLHRGEAAREAGRVRVQVGPLDLGVARRGGWHREDEGRVEHDGEDSVGEGGDVHSECGCVG
jgi:hypothetical protein